MGVPTWEVGHTSAMARSEDHEVCQGHVGHGLKKKTFGGQEAELILYGRHCFPFSSFGVFILVLLFKNTCWFVCSCLYCIAFGRTWGMFPSLTKPHEIAAAGPDRLKGWQGSTKCQAPVFFIKRHPQFGAATARAHLLLGLMKWNVSFIFFSR